MTAPQFLLAAVALATTPTLAQNARANKPIHQHAATQRIDLLTQQAPTAYENQMVVTVTIENKNQLHNALELAESPWTERPGLGPVTLQITRDAFDDLTALGVNPVVQIPDLQAHNRQQWSRLVSKERIESQNKAGAFRPMEQIQRGASSHDENWFTGYKQLADIYAYMDAQILAHPDLISKADFGDTIEGRDLFAYTITAPDAPGNLAADRPVIIWNGAQHAREWVSPMTVTYIASKLIDDINTDPEVGALMNSARFVIIPVLNPDGYLYTWSTERYWRKNRRNNPGSFEGVDLNRNWDSHFGGEGTSADPSSDVYHGVSAFSEPETAALSALALSYGDDLVAHIDYHTFSQLILWPLGYTDNLVTPEPDRTKFINLSGDMSALILSISGRFYNPIQSWRLYPAAGTCSDWFYEDAGVPSLTVELRPGADSLDGFAPPDTEILPAAQENWEAAKLFARRTTEAISLSHDPIGIVDADTPTPISLQVVPGISEVEPSSVTLHARVGSQGDFGTITMIDNGSAGFVGHLPDAPCGQSIEYYFTASPLEGMTMTYPPGGPDETLSALSQLITIAFDDNIEHPTAGWTIGQPTDTATTGVWERADPQVTNAQPEDDHTPDNGTICWITGGEAGGSLGANDIDGGATTLTSPLMNATEAGAGAELIYWRWYSNNAGAAPDADSMLIQISENNGDSWSTLETVTENTGQWVEKRYLVSSITTSAIDQIRLRFIASDLGDGSIVEAGIDDLRIESTRCPQNIADLNGDGELDFLDISAFLGFYGESNPSADLNGDGEWDFLDISAFLAAYSAR